MTAHRFVSTDCSHAIAITRALDDARHHALATRSCPSFARVQPEARRPGERARVAVIGGGAAGIATAYELTRRGIYVELFEAAPRLGGNCDRVVVPGPDGRHTNIDVGVSDYNRATFHRFTAFLSALGVESKPICEDATTLFADGQTAWRSDSDALASEIARFVRMVPAALEAGGNETLGAYLARMGYSEVFKSAYARPRAGGCIVMPRGDPESHDLRTLVRFWQLHGLVGSRPRQRMHVVGGMWSYCDAFARWFRARGGASRTGTRVVEIKRGARQVRVTWAAGGAFGVSHFDHVVLAVDASHVAAIVPQVDEHERRALASVRYEHAEVIVHRDTRVMPRDRRHWAAYQFYAERPGERRAGPAAITFYPHRMTGDAGADGIFVSLSPPVAPREVLVLARRHFVHPVADPSASRPELFDRIQGHKNTWYAGSYLEAPWLHEQAFRSGGRVAQAIADVVTTTDVGRVA